MGMLHQLPCRRPSDGQRARSAFFALSSAAALRVFPPVAYYSIFNQAMSSLTVSVTSLFEETVNFSGDTKVVHYLGTISVSTLPFISFFLPPASLL
jgi:hypothetical protein